MAIIGYILLGLLGLLFVLLLIPVKLVVNYVTGQPASAYVRWLFIKYDFLKEDTQLVKEKPKAERKAGREGDEKQKTAKKSPMEFSELVGTILDIISVSYRPAGRFIKKFRIYRLHIHMVVAEGDAAETALAYGKVSAAIYTAYALACNFLNLGKPDISIMPDFTKEEGRVDFELRGRLLPIYALDTGIRIAYAFLVKTIKRRQRREEPHPRKTELPQAK